MLGHFLSKTIHNTSCQVKISKKERCLTCDKYRKNQFAQTSLKKSLEVTPVLRTSQSSHVIYIHLSAPQKVTRMRAL
uniref:Uncharacterized protein n=1 Tax=Amphimedon queenslandica TaxID=400682 RepID=A0A1X7TNU7_AMPQE